MNPSTRLSISLEAQQWNLVLATLAEGSFRVVAPLIQEIQRQCNEQDEPTIHPQKTNGAETRETRP